MVLLGLRSSLTHIVLGGMAVTTLRCILAIVCSTVTVARMLPKEVMVKPLPRASIKQHRAASLLAAQTSETGEVQIMSEHTEAVQQAPFVPHGVYSPAANAVVKPMTDNEQAAAVLLNPQLPNPQNYGHSILHWATPSSRSHDDDRLQVLGPAAASAFLEDTLDSPLSHTNVFPMLHAVQSSSVQSPSVPNATVPNATVPIPIQGSGARSHVHPYVSQNLVCGEKFHIFGYHLCHLHVWTMVIVYLGLAFFACLCFWAWDHIPIKFDKLDNTFQPAPEFYQRCVTTKPPMHITGATIGAFDRNVGHLDRVRPATRVENTIVDNTIFEQRSPRTVPVDSATALPLNTYIASSLPAGRSTTVPVGTATTLPLGTSTTLPVRTATASLSPFGTSTALPVGASTTLPVFG